MAIVIPSSKTYDRQNPKVRDNVIERIEVSAKEVVPDNEYDVVVYNQKKLIDNDNINISDGQENFQYAVSIYENAIYLTFYYILAYAKYSNVRKENFEIRIPISSNKSYISSIKLGLNNENEPNIKYQLYGKQNIGLVSIPYTGNISATMDSQSITATAGDIYFYPQVIGTEEKPFSIEKKLVKENSMSHVGQNGKPIKIESIVEQHVYGNLDKVTYTIENDEIVLSLKDIVTGARYVTADGAETDLSAGDINGTMSGSYIEWIATNIELTVYGNTIGIDLVDKTVYINGETQKKVHSIEGNELMQTTNTGNLYPTFDTKELKLEKIEEDSFNSRHKVSFKDGNAREYNVVVLLEIVDEYGEAENWEVVIYAGNTYGTRIASSQSTARIISAFTQYTSDTSQLELYFSETLSKYQKGKETATIRCSISDYYNENGEKEIAIDNSTRKMCFAEYDEVVPMVYGADGKDYPMSSVDDKAKMFQVLGVKFYYDGAVWQELSLQECGAVEIKEEEPDIPSFEPLLPPIISIDGSILTVTTTDSRMIDYTIYVDGNAKATSSDNTFDLSTLELSAGTYAIKVKGRAKVDDNTVIISEDSNLVNYIVTEIKEPLTAPTISLDGSTLTMTATDSRTQEFVIFVDGVETTTVKSIPELKGKTFTFAPIIERPETHFNTIYMDFLAGSDPNIYGDLKYSQSCYALRSGITAGDNVIFVTYAHNWLRYPDGSQRLNVDNRWYQSTIGWEKRELRNITINSTTDEIINRNDIENVIAFYKWLMTNNVFLIYFPDLEDTEHEYIYAREGMTWGEWINSNLNTTGFFNYSGAVAFRYYGDLVVVSGVNINDTIDPNEAYSWDYA